MHDHQERFEELWNDYLEGDLNENGMQELHELLEATPELVSDAADMFQLHRLLGVIANQDDTEAFVEETMDRIPDSGAQFVRKVMQHDALAAKEVTRAWGWKMALSGVLVASFAIIAIGLWSLRSEAIPKIVRVSGMGGPFLWTGDGGQVVNDVSSGMELSGGTLEGIAPDSWAKLVFVSDGTTVTISGKSLLTFSEYVQKELHLREGNIAANVTPQPAGRPMLVHTRSATLEVLGTSFDVDAQLTSTKLNVTQGKVRLKSLLDGESVDVTADHRAVAAPDVALDLVRVPDIVNSWQSDIPAGPADLLGKWLPANEAKAARLLGVPLVVELPNIDPITLYLAALPISGGDDEPVELESKASFEVSGQLKAESRLYFGIHVVDDRGNFAGKFLAHTPVAPDEQGDFVANLSASLFELDVTMLEYKDKLPKSPVNYVVKDCWCFTLENSGLALTEVKLQPVN